MKRILFFTLAVLLSALSASAYYDFKVDGIAYNYNATTISSSSYCYVTTGSDKNLEHINIPSHVTSYRFPVTSISSGAFRDYTSIKSIIIPNSVTSIGSGAFSGCSNLRYMQLMCTTPHGSFI